MFATRKPRRTSSPFKVILTEEKDIICFHRRKNKILAAKLQIFFDFAIEIRRFLFDNVANYYTLGLKAQKNLARGRAKASPRVNDTL